ncbi:MAG: hypothetical protein LDL51_04280 [Chloroflexi bacterium]|nr:hypothetical protein [Chloroflexota bacterium]
MFALGLLSEGGESPDAALLWMLIVALAFFFLMVAVGWLVSRNKKAETGVHYQPDDLAKMEGVGPKVVQLLNAAGIKTFEALAHAEVSRVQKILDDAGLRMMNPEGWIEQAKLAAKGDWEGFERLQSELKGGRKVS